MKTLIQTIIAHLAVTIFLVGCGMQQPYQEHLETQTTRNLSMMAAELEYPPLYAFVECEMGENCTCNTTARTEFTRNKNNVVVRVEETEVRVVKPIGVEEACSAAGARWCDYRSCVVMPEGQTLPAGWEYAN